MKILGYMIPSYGNKRSEPYCKVNLNERKYIKTIEVWEEFTYKGVKYIIKNYGSLYHPDLKIEQIED